MKTILIAMMFLMLQTHSSAQISCGITAGFISSNYHFHQDGMSFTPKSKSGFTAGLFTNLHMTQSVSLQPAVNFVQKGFSFTDPDYGGKEMTSVNFIEVPVNLVYKSDSRRIGFFAGAGPSIAFAISGKGESTYQQTTEKVKLSFGNSEEDDIRGVDFGANILAGIQLKKGFILMANYNFGISNTLPQGDSQNKVKSSYIAVKVGYAFR